MTLPTFQRYGPVVAVLLLALSGYIVGREGLRSCAESSAVVEGCSAREGIRPQARGATVPRPTFNDASSRERAETRPANARDSRAVEANGSRRQPSGGALISCEKEALSALRTGGRSFPPAVAAIPFSFSIPEGLLSPGCLEEELVYREQFKFVEDMNSLPDADPATPEYTDHWNRAAGSHDDRLRLFLGGSRYVQLTAMALQAEQAAKE